MEHLDWIVAGGLFVVGLLAAIGIYLGKRDPKTRLYLPSIAAEFQLGRVRAFPDPNHERDTDDKGDKDQKDDRIGKR